MHPTDTLQHLRNAYVVTEDDVCAADITLTKIKAWAATVPDGVEFEEAITLLRTIAYCDGGNLPAPHRLAKYINSIADRVDYDGGSALDLLEALAAAKRPRRVKIVRAFEVGVIDESPITRPASERNPFAVQAS
jgi:hypothetical protein